MLAEQESQTEVVAGPDRKREKSPSEEKTGQNMIASYNHTEMRVEEISCENGDVEDVDYLLNFLFLEI